MIAGVAAAAIALGVAQLVGIPFGARADARAAIGSAVVDLAPGPVKEWAIQTLGSLDKLFVAVAVLVVIAAIAAIAGTLETRRRPLGSAAITAAGALGCVAVLSRQGATALDTIPTVAGAACGVAALRLLTRRFRPAAQDPGDGADHDETDVGRRRLVALGLLGLGVASGVAGAVITRLVHSVAADRSGFTLPRPRISAAPIPADVQPKGVALPSFVTPSADFYRVDTALSVPQLSHGDWRLRIHGMVNREATYSFADLAGFDVVEKGTTLTCVSNPVGGDLISTGIWTGYRVADLLAAAGVHPDADMVLSTSIDGFTAGTPVEALTDGRDALLAVALNGQPLPIEHGYPARLVVPGLYGYVSATKWVVEMELTRFDKAEAYWTRQGWAARAPIKTESRIDVPRDGQQVPIGPVVFGGVAWAQNRGVRAVEVRIDGGEWQPAEQGASYSNETWRLWSFPWQAKIPGKHSITVRATDNTGATQTADRVATVPDGATGWHTVDFTVAGS
ncbi:molybdopterin-dependent oxidoreductase [Mycobacterium paraseoulense]|uniref:Oxidoreductase n=1 Tax=Mycobacterium paraseoulense TaxID=590652 RepID=A0A1X0I948_9MYCO|nr:molybdopterin-dependent oxidoreductase [Mycobacterium paraseoulense]MCV7397506.1 molybdopterin-dependent oxidoreductase [Mycobacterium paraseoulense]ORB39750.1 oxidoreductase [Mycobacterium paraseoulense]BBZ70117.1 oxidoreductase [Mycobacterium paraseoulense]